MGTEQKNALNNQVDKKARGITYALQKRLYSIREASFYLGRSVWAVREMLWAGKIPYIKDGKRILIDLRDMEAWISANKIKEIF